MSDSCVKTLLITDLVGSTDIIAALGDAKSAKLFAEVDRLVRDLLRQYNGQEIDRTDGFFILFERTTDAVAFAVDFHRSLPRVGKEFDKTLKSRVGIHVGEVYLRNNSSEDVARGAKQLEVEGLAKPLTARLMSIARGGQTLMTSTAYELVRRSLQLQDVQPEQMKWLNHGRFHLKGVGEPIEVYEFGITGESPFVNPTGRKHANRKFLSFAALSLVIIVFAFYMTIKVLVPSYSAYYVEIADFKNLMADNREPDFFSAGITEALRSQLADIRDIYIIEPDKGVRAPIRLEGSVQRIEDSVRISYRLMRRKDNVQIAGGKLDGAYKDLFILQDRVVAEIAGYLADEFGLPNFRPAAIQLTSDLTAYEYYLRGSEYMRRPSSQENYDQAINYFTTALIHDPEFSAANTGICGAYLGNYTISADANLLSKAKEYCELSLQNTPNVDALVTMSKVETVLGDYASARQYLNEAMLIAPDNYDAQYQLAEVFRGEQRFDLAEAIFRELMRKFPKHWQSYNAIATLFIDSGQFKQAIPFLDSALKLTPENEFVLNNLGAAYLYIGDFLKSAQYFERAAEMIPTGYGYSNAASIYYYAGDFEKARELYTQARKLLPDVYQISLNLADTYRHLGDRSERSEMLYKEVVKQTRSKITLNKEDGKAYQALALAAVYLLDTETALDAIEKAFAYSRDNDPELYYSSAKVYMFLNQINVAEAQIKALLALGYPADLIRADPDLMLFTGTEEDI
ncbi:tetratricopeptide repeat protein [Alteromonas sp. ASW11-36]|uniref:Tetratricopeptide repeat protein n=1 Tax=Alteromonas arenosi TaxID=3055817 RepID=A0ABT7SYZ0_9ALTE|nr:tetratricopeptide repeat protein [Alteromonas sp. ASW11-36]MDM7861375.1 tetratricopeptide repeat protein [Alteromonas sp. ASW11-36]